MKRSNLKRGKPMKRRTTRKETALHSSKLQQHYRDQRDYCEASEWLRKNWRELYFDDDRLDLHHICDGSGRLDLWTNMIRVNHTFHDWIGANDFNGNVICLGMKLLNNELDLDEYTKCSGWRLEWWLETKTPAPQVQGLWGELMAVAKTQKNKRYGE